jgi:hypothetical protein
MRVNGLVALLLALCACSPSRGIRPNDRQVVAQWLTSDHASSALGVIGRGFQNVWTERAIEKACESLCFDDGNDVGSGTFNVYLYTQDAPSTVQMLIGLEKAGSIPPGLRIGVARYRDKGGRDWIYEGVYPPKLQTFDLSYQNSK